MPKSTVAILVLLLIAAGNVRAQDRYYAVVFGSEGRSKRPKFTHVWASVVRVRDGSEDLHQRALDVYTVSWMPATLEIRTLRPIPEEGANLGLGPTLDWALSTGQEVCVWGPHEIRESGFYRVLHRINDLNSGRVKYQCIDPFFCPRRVMDCIHAVTSLDPLHTRFRYPLIRFGHAAAEHFVEEMTRNGVVLDSDAENQWLLDRLCLKEPVVDRRFVSIQPRKNIDRILERLERKAMGPPCVWPPADLTVSAGETVCPMKLPCLICP